VRGLYGAEEEREREDVVGGGMATRSHPSQLVVISTEQALMYVCLYMSFMVSRSCKLLAIPLSSLKNSRRRRRF
jgi:hypothetical protein